MKQLGNFLTIVAEHPTTPGTKHQGVVTVRSRTVNQDGDEVQVLTSKILVLKRSAHPTE